MYMPERNDAEFENPPEGSHLAVCYRVIDLGTQQQEWKGQTKHYRKVLLSWELPDEKMEDGRPFAISQRYTYSSSEKARLRKDLESWRGQRFKESDFGPGGFDIKNILEKGCYLSIVHNDTNDRIYANINAIMKLPKGVEVPALSNDTVYFSLDPERFNKAILDNLSDNLQSTIKASPEYHELMNGSGPEDPPETAGGVTGHLDEGAPFDDSIPFAPEWR